MSERFLMIIQTADKDRANQIAKSDFDIVGGENTFTVPLFTLTAQDDSTPTHYWASGDIQDDKVADLQSLQSQFQGSTLLAYNLNTQPNLPQQTLISLNLRTAKSNMPK